MKLCVSIYCFIYSGINGYSGKNNSISLLTLFLDCFDTVHQSWRIQQTLGIFEIIDRINLNDVLFLVLLFCFLFIKGYKRSEHKDTILLNISILIFLIYYFVVFGFITPQLRKQMLMWF